MEVVGPKTSVIENSLVGLNSKVEMTQNRINETEDRSQNSSNARKIYRKKMDNMKILNIHTI